MLVSFVWHFFFWSTAVRNLVHIVQCRACGALAIAQPVPAARPSLPLAWTASDAGVGSPSSSAGGQSSSLAVPPSPRVSAAFPASMAGGPQLAGPSSPTKQSSGLIISAEAAAATPSGVKISLDLLLAKGAKKGKKALQHRQRVVGAAPAQQAAATASAGRPSRLLQRSLAAEDPDALERVERIRAERKAQEAAKARGQIYISPEQQQQQLAAEQAAAEKTKQNAVLRQRRENKKAAKQRERVEAAAQKAAALQKAAEMAAAEEEAAAQKVAAEEAAAEEAAAVKAAAQEEAAAVKAAAEEAAVMATVRTAVDAAVKEAAVEKAAADKAAAEQVAADRAAADKAAAEEQAAADAEKPVVDAAASATLKAAVKAAVEEPAVEKPAADKAAADFAAKNVAEQAAADRAAAEEETAERAAASKAAAAKEEAKKAAAAKAATDQGTAEKAAADHIAADQASSPKAAADRVSTQTSAQQQVANNAASRQETALRAAATAARGQEPRKAATDKHAAANKAAASAVIRFAHGPRASHHRNLFSLNKDGAGSAPGNALGQSMHTGNQLAQRRGQAGEEVAESARDALNQASRPTGTIISDQQKHLTSR